MTKQVDNILNAFLRCIAEPQSNTSVNMIDYRVSFNACVPDTGLSETAIICTCDTAIFGEKYFILEGDHRDALKTATLSQAMQYWRDRPKQWGWSSDTEYEGGAA